MTKSQHTPTLDFATGQHDVAIYCVEDDERIASVSLANEGWAEDIVKRFNAHDALVEALAYLAGECDDSMDEGYNPHAAPLAKARAALKLAKEG